MEPRTSRALFVAVLLVLLAFVSGCGDDDDATVDAGADGDTTDGETTDEGEPRAVDIEALTASTWVLRFGGGPEGDVPLVDGWPITITFSPDGTVGGTAACNGYGGVYAIEGSQLALGQLAWTEMGCEPAVQASEAAYLAALLDVDGIDLFDGGLALSGMSTELLFVSTEPAPLDELVDRPWLLEALLVEGEEVAVEGRPATLRIDADGSFVASTGCRDLVGRYVVSGNGVLFNEMSAEGDCPTSLFDQDSSVIAVLGDGFVPTVDGDLLTLSSAGDEGLRYRAVTEDELGAETGSPVASDADLLDGVEWRFVGGDSPDGPIADPMTIDPSAVITLIVADGAYEGTVVCNRYGGSAEIGDSLWNFALGVPSAEEQGCGDELDAIAAAYLDALPQMNEGGLEGDGARLVVNGNEIELWFERVG